MNTLIKVQTLSILILICICRTAYSGTVTGELKKWHKVTITFNGPSTSEEVAKNPFTDYRLNVTFTHVKSGKTHIVPGHYAADGSAGETGTTEGNKWRVHFTPYNTGKWNYTASFRTGKNIAIDENETAGSATSFDDDNGNFIIVPTDKSGRDHRGKGMLNYVGKHHLQFAETGEYFLKGGADSPENFLGYKDFDGTPNYHHQYIPHRKDYDPDDASEYTWKNGMGKNILGAIKYLSGKGMNSIYFMTMNAPKGDGKDVWIWISETERYRFDCSKLDQWEKVFSYMDKKGILLHLITQETENDQQLDNGELGPQRKLYYRELIARFSHHLALVWNLGEENSNTDEQRKAFATYFKNLDPYSHPTVVHTSPNKRKRNLIYNALVGYKDLDGPSIQTTADVSIIHAETKKWIDRSSQKNHKWFVCIDEPGDAKRGCDHDSRITNNQTTMRKEALWGNLIAGGAGVEWYLGYKNPHNDLNCEDWRSRDKMWDITRYALEFFKNNNIPFHEMISKDELVKGNDNWCLVKTGEIYAIYLKNGGTTELDLRDVSGTFEVKWYDPRNGGELKNNIIKSVKGGAWQSPGNPPDNIDKDWAILVRKQ